MAFYNDKLLLSHSFGILPSRVVFYEKSDKRLYVDENSAVSYRFPERIEQIFVDGDDLYVLFESAAYAYSSAVCEYCGQGFKTEPSQNGRIPAEHTE